MLFRKDGRSLKQVAADQEKSRKDGEKARLLRWERKRGGGDIRRRRRGKRKLPVLKGTHRSGNRRELGWS